LTFAGAKTLRVADVLRSFISSSQFVWRFAVRGNAPNKRLWETVWRASFREIVEALTGINVYSPEALHFLEWNTGEPTTADVAVTPTGDNVFKYPEDDPAVSIRVGSVHSVKGETHTSILVLETFWHKHNLESLLPWLNGSRSGGSGAGERDRARLKLHYVGFTRPSHLLCLAMKRTSFEKDGQLDQQLIANMQARRWNVQFVC
jgi:DNA helicase II / ATP-dependent DNA helicase PcrA